MQIEDGRIIGWLWWIVTAVGGIVAFLIGFIYRTERKHIYADRARITVLEEQMRHAVTMPQVEHIGENLKKEFKDDHSMIIHGQRAIMTTIDHNKEEMKEYIRDMFEAREARWNGRDRRKQ